MPGSIYPSQEASLDSRGGGGWLQLPLMLKSSLWCQTPGGSCLNPYLCRTAPLACFPHYFEAYLWPHFLSKSFAQDFPSQALNLGLESSRPQKALKDLHCPTNTHEVLWAISIPKLHCKGTHAWYLRTANEFQMGKDTYLWTFQISYPRKTSTTATYLDGKNALSTICFHQTGRARNLTVKGPSYQCNFILCTFPWKPTF